MKKLFTLILMALLPTISMADDQAAPAKSKEQGSGPNPYTECGIGAAIFSTVEWAAATSNVIWDLGLTAITSAVSSPETCNAKKIKTAKLILETLPELEKDVAKGSGIYLQALNETMGCNQSAQAKINSSIRASYSNVVSDKNYGSKTKVERAADMYNSVKEAAVSASGACNVIL